MLASCANLRGASRPLLMYRGTGRSMSYGTSRLPKPSRARPGSGEDSTTPQTSKASASGSVPASLEPNEVIYLYCAASLVREQLLPSTGQTASDSLPSPQSPTGTQSNH